WSSLQTAKLPNATWANHAYHAHVSALETFNTVWPHLDKVIGTDHRFGSRADLSPFTLAGHSLGGYTVLGLAVRGRAGNSLRSWPSGLGLLHGARNANSSNDWGWS